MEKKAPRRQSAAKKTRKASTPKAQPAAAPPKPKKMDLHHFAQMITHVRSWNEVEPETIDLRNTGSRMLSAQITLVVEPNEPTMWRVTLFGKEYGIQHVTGGRAVLLDLDTWLEVEIGEPKNEATQAIGGALLALCNALLEAAEERHNFREFLRSMWHWDPEYLLKMVQENA